MAPPSACAHTYADRQLIVNILSLEYDANSGLLYGDIHGIINIVH